MKLLYLVMTLFYVSFINAFTPSFDMYDTQADTLQELPDSRLAQIYQEIIDLTEDNFFQKRADDSSTVSALTQVLENVENSGLIMDILEEIAASPTQTDNLANLTVSLLKNGGGLIGGINITLNYTSLWDTVKLSGIIFSTLDGLMLNVSNRNFLADRIGVMLKRNPWVAELLTQLGAGHALTVSYLHELITTFKSKASNWDEMLQQTSMPNSKSVIIGARDDSNSSGQYDGSAQEFLSNLINTVANSALADQSIGNLLQAVNDSGIVIPVVLDVLNSTSVLGMFGTIIGKVYDSGVLDGIDLNSYYQLAKKNHFLTNAIQIGLTDPTYSPSLARILQRMEINGVYQQTQWNLHGGPDKK